MGKMMRIWITVVAMMVCLGGSQTALWAATLSATPESYVITLHQVRVYNQDDSTWYIAGTGDLTFDIASTDAGTSVGNYISGASLAVGTYSQVEATLSRTFGIKARVLDLGGGFGGGDSMTWWYTTTGTLGSAISCTSVPFPWPDTPPGNYAVGTAVLPAEAELPATETIEGDYLIHTETLQTNIIIRAGETRTIRVSFDITNSATFEDNAGAPPVVCYPSPPVITITQIE